jgi:hypothetical protein
MCKEYFCGEINGIRTYEKWDNFVETDFQEMRCEDFNWIKMA